MTERRIRPRSTADVALPGDGKSELALLGEARCSKPLPGERVDHPLLTIEPLGLSRNPVADSEDLRRRIRERLDLVWPYFMTAWGNPFGKANTKH